MVLNAEKCHFMGVGNDETFLFDSVLRKIGKNKKLSVLLPLFIRRDLGTSQSVCRDKKS